MAGRIVIGTSSWADPGFVEDWYPRDLPARDRLSWYAEHFDAVEVNSTFYAIPQVSTVERWVEQTPDGFTFDVKLHKLLSRHSAQPDALPKDLRDDADATSRGRVVLDGKLQDALADRIRGLLRRPFAGPVLPAPPDEREHADHDGDEQEAPEDRDRGVQAAER